MKIRFFSSKETRTKKEAQGYKDKHKPGQGRKGNKQAPERAREVSSQPLPRTKDRNQNRLQTLQRCTQDPKA